MLFLFAGFYAGIIKSFFAVSAGFFATILAENYPYQEGINYYFVFVATAVIIFIIGIIVFKFVKFLYLSLFDKIAGAGLGLFLSFLLVANFVIPTIQNAADIVANIKTKTGYITNLSSKAFPMFGKYMPNKVFGEDLGDILKQFPMALKNLKKADQESVVDENLKKVLGT